VQFRPSVYDAADQQVPVVIEPVTPQDAVTTTTERGGRRIGPANISQKVNSMSMGWKRGLANWWPWELMRSAKMWLPSTLSIWRVRRGTAVF